MSSFNDHHTPPTIQYSRSLMPFEPLRAMAETNLVSDEKLFEDTTSPFFHCNVWCRDNNFPYFTPSEGTYTLKLSQPVVITSRLQSSIRSNGQPHESDDLPMLRNVNRREVITFFRRCHHLARFLSEHNGGDDAAYKFVAAFIPTTDYPTDPYTYASPLALLLSRAEPERSTELTTYTVEPTTYVRSHHGPVSVSYGDSLKPSANVRLTVKHLNTGEPGQLFRHVWTTTTIPPLWDTVIAYHKMSGDDKNAFLDNFKYRQGGSALEAVGLETATPYDQLALHYGLNGDKSFEHAMHLHRTYAGMRSVLTSSVLVNMVQKASELEDPSTFAKCIKSQCNQGTEDMLSRYGPDCFVQIYGYLSDRGFPELEDILDCDNCGSSHACEDLDCGDCTCCEALTRVNDLEQIIEDAKSRLDDA